MFEVQKILVVDDEKNIVDIIKFNLKKEGYEVITASNGREAIEKNEAEKPDLIMLDIMMPEIDGYEACRKIREKYDTPIIMLTARAEELDKVLGLELGADDYMVKPFEPKELTARVKAVLRRYDKTENTVDENVLTYDNLEINLSNYTVKYYGEFLNFPPKEFELLYFLAKRPNQVFTRDQLLDKIWGYEYIGDTRTVDVHIKRIREKFNRKDKWSVKTVWGVGYKFEVE